MVAWDVVVYFKAASELSLLTRNPNDHPVEHSFWEIVEILGQVLSLIIFQRFTLYTEYEVRDKISQASAHVTHTKNEKK